jgi:hypothetical protein
MLINAKEAHEATKQNRIDTLVNVKKLLIKQEKRFNKTIQKAIDRGEVSARITNLNIPYCSGQRLTVETLVEAYFQDAGYKIIHVYTEDNMIDRIVIGWSEV